MGTFGYGQPGHQGQFTAQDYGQFPVPDPSLQQQGSGAPACSWPGVPSYFAAPTGGSVHSAGSRAGSVEDYSGVYTTSQGQNTAPAAYPSPYHARGSMSLPAMQPDYNGAPAVASTMGHSPLGGSPSPTHMSAGMVGMVGANNVGVAQRQQSTRPYDWLKKQTYPAAPSSGEQ